MGASSNASSSYPWEDLQTKPDVLGRLWSSEAALDPEVTFRTQRLSKDPKVIWEPADPEVVLNPEVVWEPGGSSRPEGRFEPGGRFGIRSSSRPRGRFEPGGTVLCLPRQDYSLYLFRFRIHPLGSWPLSSSYAVFYFCRKSLTGLEGAGVGVMTQVPGFAAFHVWRSRVLIAP
ncbi:hypothetical protein DY000_02021838 [Brassica cretica]|uniref:Uncharacterized protein n=1 Tax=Brassica cretica TaxID=69181 RepID=A0ABQ7DZN7_BRACR|nr:hypothetical protein DY000_02021838 [Brassica cretica]